LIRHDKEIFLIEGKLQPDISFPLNIKNIILNIPCLNENAEIHCYKIF